MQCASMHSRSKRLSSCMRCFCVTCRGAIPADVRVLPDRIILVRHAQSEGNVDCDAYTYIPDPQVPLVSGWCKQQGLGASNRAWVQGAACAAAAACCFSIC
jgi:hypothetical protein